MHNRTRRHKTTTRNMRRHRKYIGGENWIDSIFNFFADLFKRLFYFKHSHNKSPSSPAVIAVVNDAAKPSSVEKRPPSVIDDGDAAAIEQSPLANPPGAIAATINAADNGDRDAAVEQLLLTNSPGAIDDSTIVAASKSSHSVPKYANFNDFFNKEKDAESFCKRFIEAIPFANSNKRSTCNNTYEKYVPNLYSNDDTNCIFN